MSVYTHPSDVELQELLNNYNIGNLIDFSGIDEGITNSNFFLNTESGSYVLTIFEEPNLNLDFTINLMNYLSNTGIPCPIPIFTKDKKLLSNIKEKQCTIVTRLKGKTVSNNETNIEMCKQVGNVLGEIHNNSKGYKNTYEGVRNNQWFTETSKKIRESISDDDNEIIQECLKNLLNFKNKNIPKGVIHGDLFRDNVMFEKNKLSGVIDFNYACTGNLIYDLAITVNDWCINKDGTINIEKQNAMILSYSSKRKIEENEKNSWNLILCFAALRFWLSRLYDSIYPTDGHLTHLLNPDEFKVILLDRMNNKYQIKL